MATVRLCHVDFNNRYEDVIDFTSRAYQIEYFTNATVATITNFQYVKKNDSYIVVNYALDSSTIRRTNYVFVDNGDSYYFFFVTDKRYNALNVTYLDLELDFWNTYPYSIMWNFVDNYVEREHQNRWNSDGSPNWSDTDEGFNLSLEHPLYINPIKQNARSGGTIECCFVVFVYVTSNSYWIYTKPWFKDTTINCYSSNDLGTQFILESYNGFGFDPSNVNIKNVYVVPYIPNSLGNNLNIRISSNGDYYIDAIAGNIEGIGNCFSVYNSTNFREATVLKFLSDISKPVYNIASLRSINNESKMFSSQFYRRVLFAHNQKIEIKNEYINALTTIDYFISVSTTRTVNYMLYRYGRKAGSEGYTGNEYYNMSDNSFSQLPTLTDTDGMYLSSHQQQIQTNYFASLFSTFASMAGSTALFYANPANLPISAVTGINALVSGINTVASQRAKVEDSKNTIENFQTSNSDGYFDRINLDGGVLNEAAFTSADDVRSAVYDYLYMFGYATNKLKTPDVRSRYYFNYIKLSGFNYSRLMSQTDSFSVAAYEKIRNILENGVRLWHYNENTRTAFALYNYTNENVEMIFVE